MTDKIIERISSLRVIRMLQSAPTPRWIIFTIDTLIIAVVASLVFVFPPEYFGASTAMRQIAYVLLVATYAGCNLATGCYKCIVRFSVPYDLFKVFWCVVLASCIVGTISFGVWIVYHRILINVIPIVLVAGVSLSLMESLRIVIKHLYGELTHYLEKREPVIVLSTSFNAVSLACILRDEVEGAFNPVALLSLNADTKRSKLNGLPVENFSPDTVGEIFKKHQAKTLVFLQSHMEMMRSGFADNFIRNQIKLKMLNQYEEFDMNEKGSATHFSANVNAIKIEDLLSRPVIRNENPLVKEQIHDNTVLITGAAGSIGSEIVRQVAAFGAGCIVLLDQAETPMHNMQLEMEEHFPDVNVEYYVADVTNRNRLERVFRKYKPQIVYHAAAYKHVPMMERNPSEALLTNVAGTRNLADLSLQYGVRKFVMVSTDKAVNPTNIMGASKRIAEIYVQSLFLRAMEQNGADKQSVPQFITTRFGNVLGSNGSVIPIFRHQIEQGGPVTITHRDIIRYFMTIQEACSLVLEAGCMGNGGEIFLFDMGEPVKIYDLARRMILMAGLKPEEDIKIIETGLRPGEKLYEELLNDKEKTLPTSNKKIMIAKVRQYNFNAVNAHIDNIIRLASEGNVHDMVMSMKELVPEYVSNNSVFEKIDKELQHSNA